MTESPAANISLTFEQLAQIETTKSTLSNLENEIKIANKDLGILNKDLIKATKEREYQEELTDKLSEQILEKKNELSGLNASISQVQESIAIFHKQETESRKRLIEDETKLKESQILAESFEKELIEKQEAFKIEAQKQARDREDLDIAFDTFTEALKTIKWKSNRE